MIFKICGDLWLIFSIKTVVCKHKSQCFLRHRVYNYFWLNYYIYLGKVSKDIRKHLENSGNLSHRSAESRQRHSSTSSVSSNGSFTFEPAPAVFYVPCEEDVSSPASRGDRNRWVEIYCRVTYNLVWFQINRNFADSWNSLWILVPLLYLGFCVWSLIKDIRLFQGNFYELWLFEIVWHKLQKWLAVFHTSWLTSLSQGNLHLVFLF